MRILHLAAGNRWTGAAAPAFAEVVALRDAGHDAHYAYVGGYKLQAKIGHFDFAHPLIEKAQNPLSFARTVSALGRLIRHHGFEVVHAHLTYDHWLARLAVRGTSTELARTFHARRVLRDDLLTRALLRRTDLVFVINDTFASAGVLRGREAVFTPPPLDTAQFEPEGADVRAQYGIPADAPVIVMIGKLSAGRGFEEGLRTFAIVRRSLPAARLMVIGHGEHRPALEALAAELGITDALTWAGYHEDDLAEHYRAADALLFTARGSDEGHRAVLEAMACGVVPLTFPIDGLSALLGDLAHELIAAAPSPESLASLAAAKLSSDLTALRRRSWEQSQQFSYSRAAERLIRAYA